jgi:hypothetical protein
MVRTEISLFLKNAPGELGKLATLFSEAGINIDALTIQDCFSRQLQFDAQGLGRIRADPTAGRRHR